MKLGAFIAVSLSVVVVWAEPTVKDVSLSQDAATKLVTISYDLSGAPAVVTAEILLDGVKVDDAVFSTATGDVNRYLSDDGVHTLAWQPTKAFANRAGNLTARVTAWDPAHPPAYMVVDLSTPTVQRVNYYASEAGLPGGIGSDVYRQTKLVLRRIDAKDVSWMKGPESRTYTVTLDHDYYIGVFEITKAQWMIIGGSTRSKLFAVESSMRPMGQVSYVQVRWNSLNSSYGTSGAGWPSAPNANSYLGKLNSLTGLSFDLPSESEWEFAARAGHSGNVCGDGSPLTAENLSKFGRFSGNGGTITAAYNYNEGNDATETWTTDNGSAKVGSYKANDWGLYDMQGNVWELCLGWWGSDQADPITVKPSDPKTPVRGGCYTSNYGDCAVTKRSGLQNCNGNTLADLDEKIGFRVTCAVGAVK